MSGGVDSSVAAALLLEQGYEVIGATMQVWPKEPPEDGARTCCSLEAVEEARRVARILGIRHYLLNFREAFQRQVIDHFAASYARGETPNPCLRCNRHLKFGALLRRALEIDAPWVATGHYARLHREGGSGRWIIRRAIDAARDQSYTLYGLDQRQLAHALFPLGEMTKAEVRTLAARLGLPVANRPDSQEICFVPHGDYARYLRETRPDLLHPGPVLDLDSEEVIGTHPGIAFYTIGQRRGLGGGRGHRSFVARISPEANALFVGREAALWSRRLVARDLVWGATPALPAEGGWFHAQIRRQALPALARARPLGEGRAQLEFARPQRAITPGQAVVCYQGEEVAFGGRIARTAAPEREERCQPSLP
jgi:tRNA-specific 2-thiouridylase